MKFSIKDSLGKCDQIRRLWIWSHLLKETADLVAFAEKIRNGKIFLFCNGV